MIKVHLNGYKIDIPHQPIYTLGDLEISEYIEQQKVMRLDMLIVGGDADQPMTNGQEMVLLSMEEYNQLLVNKIMMSEHK